MDEFEMTLESSIIHPQSRKLAGEWTCEVTPSYIDDPQRRMRVGTKFTYFNGAYDGKVDRVDGDIIWANNDVLMLKKDSHGWYIALMNYAGPADRSV